MVSERVPADPAPADAGAPDVLSNLLAVFIAAYDADDANATTAALFNYATAYFQHVNGGVLPLEPLITLRFDAVDALPEMQLSTDVSADGVCQFLHGAAAPLNNDPEEIAIVNSLAAELQQNAGAMWLVCAEFPAGGAYCEIRQAAVAE